ncbi:ETC complex I subunit conserved region-domain-containing protein [Lasiosphaeria miniovina]|uniref:ETC complex I subunit conserved region-domain-containing protein n=1 Tax=Lasiosphaeria miniovina TaxID=1954250 RepID=A0AA40ALT7_9PEZI|nr:ETC complex I subunit conserved region-domain-containing protein [Lasiosphaeria miniovina]KAK0718164.1 ETC complex I subunit conserved region-domain-containing protein [Lasiosphaeria miniovina]
MRRTLRLLASVKPARYLEASTPTGLTGLRTHASPRSTLLFLYQTTLVKLQDVPEHSLYRQSVEAVTRHRLSLVEGVEPEGYEAWAERAAELIEEHPEHFQGTASANNAANFVVGIRSDVVEGGSDVSEEGSDQFVVRHLPNEVDQRLEEWDGADLGAINNEYAKKPVTEYIDRLAALCNAQATEEGKITAKHIEYIQDWADEHTTEDESEKVAWEPEPKLTADQISELETKIGAGLIEEVVQVAEGELKLVDIMLQSRPWESLEEQPAEGQWAYFERKQ